MPKVIEFITKKLQSGDYNDSFTESLFGTPGSGTKPSGYYACDITLGVALCDDFSLWLAPMGGTVSAHYKVGENRRNWTPILYSYPQQFYAYWPVGGHITHYLGSGGSGPGGTVVEASTVFSGCSSSWASDEASGPVSYTMYDRGRAAVGQEPPSGYVKVLSNLRENNNSNPKSRTVWTWLSGAVSYGAPDNDDIWMPSKYIEITGLTKLFDYYPWERDVSGNGSFYSLNRDGSTQDATGLHRFNGNNWTRVINNYASGISDDDHGFRYNNGWKKSPESGLGV